MANLKGHWLLGVGTLLLVACAEAATYEASSSGSLGVTIRTGEFVLNPGEESFKCQDFENPFGSDVAVVRTESELPAGSSHHLTVFLEPDASDGPLQDCGTLKFKDRLHSAQQPTLARQFPTGVGIRMAGSEGLRFLMHWFNTTSEPITASAKFTLVAGELDSVREPAGFFLANNPAIHVAPNSAGAATKTCTAPANVSFFEFVSHMHRRSTHVVAQTGAGRVVYEGTEWDHPEPNVFEPPLQLGTDTDITWTCSFFNEMSEPLTYGESAETNEMCVITGLYYPAEQRLFECPL
jgi:hypothetical protein